LATCPRHGYQSSSILWTTMIRRLMANPSLGLWLMFL
jgi:hypothetical protein